MKVLNLTKKESQALQEFKSELAKKFGSRLTMVKLFGSKARGDFHKESDLDVLIVINNLSKQDSDFVLELTSDLLLEHAVFISPIIFSEKKWAYYLDLPMSLAYNIEEEGINLWQNSKSLKLN